jgi:hypothetical protein
MNDHHGVSDPCGLLQTGEELATLPEVARLLGCSGKALRELFAGSLSGRVRYIRKDEGPALYCVTDASAAVDPHREALAERRQRAADRETSERAAKSLKVAKTAAEHESRLAAKAERSRRR